MSILPCVLTKDGTEHLPLAQHNNTLAISFFGGVSRGGLCRRRRRLEPLSVCCLHRKAASVLTRKPTSLGNSSYIHGRRGYVASSNDELVRGSRPDNDGLLPSKRRAGLRRPIDGGVAGASRGETRAPPPPRSSSFAPPNRSL